MQRTRAGGGRRPFRTPPERERGLTGVKETHHGVKGPHLVVKGLIFRCKISHTEKGPSEVNLLEIVD